MLFVVAGDPWQKAGKVAAPAPDRVAMVEAALDGLEGFEVSTIEVEREGPTYTSETLEHLAASHPDAELFLVVGADAAAQLGTWHRPDAVRDLATLAVVAREASAPAAPGPGWRVVQVEMPRLDVSSTDLRRRVAEERPIDWLVPPGAVRWIRERGLYAGRT